MRNGAWRTVTRVCKQISAEFPSCAPSNLQHLERLAIIVDASSAKERWLTFDCTWKDPRSRGRGVYYTLRLELPNLESLYAERLAEHVKTIRNIDIRLVGPSGDNYDGFATFLMMFVKFEDGLTFIQNHREWLGHSPPPLLAMSFGNERVASGPYWPVFWISRFQPLKHIVLWRPSADFRPRGPLFAYEYFLQHQIGGWRVEPLRTKITLPPFLPETCSILTSRCSTLTRTRRSTHVERMEADKTYRRGLVSELAVQRWWKGLRESAASEFASWVGNWPHDRIDWTDACMMEVFEHLTYHQGLLRRSVLRLMSFLPADGGPTDLLYAHCERVNSRFRDWCDEAERRYNERARSIPLAEFHRRQRLRQATNSSYSTERFVRLNSSHGFFYTAIFGDPSLQDDGLVTKDELLRKLSKARHYTEPGYFRRTILRGRTTAAEVLFNLDNYRDRHRSLL